MVARRADAQEYISFREDQMALDQSGKTAILSRMIMPEHHCPYGLRSKDLLERHGFTVEDHHLETHDDDTEAFKKEHGVETMPETFMGRRADRRIRQSPRAFRKERQERGRDQLPACHRDLLGRIPDGHRCQLVHVRDRP